MKEENIEKLLKFNIFDFSEGRSIECDDGWFDILLELCQHLYIINETLETKPKISLIKQKFGHLRVYYHPRNDQFDKFISLAESKSAKICEKCGKDGKMRNKGWIRVLCEEHNIER